MLPGAVSVVINSGDDIVATITAVLFIPKYTEWAWAPYPASHIRLASHFAVVVPLGGMGMLANSC